MTLLYNLIMAALDLAGLDYLRRKPSVARCAAVVLVVAGAGAVGAVLLRFGAFGHIRLAACGVFIHVPVLLAGSAALLWRTHRRWAVLAALSGAAVVGIACDAFWIEPHWLEVTHLELASAKIKRPVRIVIVADLQTEEIGDYERAVLDRVRQEQPDLVLLAGDYLQVPWPDWERTCRQLNVALQQADLTSAARVFAVRGNVDPHPWMEIFEGLDITAVDHLQTVHLQELDLDLTCLPLRQSYSTGARIHRPNADRFHLVLGHVPNFALGHIDADLLVAGHTHGGQVCLPVLGPVITHSRVPRRWATGVTELPSGAKLVVSRGIGMEREDSPPMRFLCRPELVVLDLTPE